MGVYMYVKVCIYLFITYECMNECTYVYVIVRL